MGEKFFENGVWREIVEMKVPPTEGNPAGVVKIYRDQVPAGAEIVGEVSEPVSVEPVEPVVTAPWAKGKAKK